METLQKDSHQTKSNLIKTLDGYIAKDVITRRNKKAAWKYGYDKDYDVVVISKDGTIGEILEIQGLVIAIPSYQGKALSRSDKKKEQYWERTEEPQSLIKIKSTHQWKEKPRDFKEGWVSYIESQFEYREKGAFFMNNGKPHYITGSHWFYLQCSSIDVGYADYREANRVLFLHWEACVADNRCFGQDYLKIRRSGFSFMSSSECVNTGTSAKDSRIGILSKSGADAKKMFTQKVVPISQKLPFYFKPIQDGMDKPKTELSFSIPASKITKKNMNDSDDSDMVGLDTTIDWKNTEDNSYDGEKLLLLVHDESGKWVKPNNILNNWRVTKTCLRVGRKIIGKCMMGSTSNALSKGGENFKKLYYYSDVSKRNANGQTASGLYNLFIPMEWNMEGFIDRYGMPVFRKPEKPVMGVDGEYIDDGAIDYWEAEVDSLKSDSDGLNEFYRQFPRTESHAFRDESKQSLFNLTKIYQQIDHNDGAIDGHHTTRGSFSWENGIKDTKVQWNPNQNGRFIVSWTPKKSLQNNMQIRNGVKYPLNENIGVFGCDSYDISGTVGGGGSNGALHGLTVFNMEEAPSNEFFLEYIARPKTAEIFFEDVLMACVFYGMPILVENNKPRLLYHFKNRGYRGFSINRPDKAYNKLSRTEKELGGIPNSSEDVKQAHSAAIESYIEEYIGLDDDSRFRDNGEMGSMPFNRTLNDWAKFEIDNRTKYDASISSGLAIMASRKHLYRPIKKESKIFVNFARYNNKGSTSEIIR